jgi:hypothetical protein
MNIRCPRCNGAQPSVAPQRSKFDFDDSAQLLLGAFGSRGEVLARKEEVCQIAERLTVPLDRSCFGRIPPLRPLDLAEGRGRILSRSEERHERVPAQPESAVPIVAVVEEGPGLRAAAPDPETEAVHDCVVHLVFDRRRLQRPDGCIRELQPVSVPHRTPRLEKPNLVSPVGAGVCLQSRCRLRVLWSAVLSAWFTSGSL